MSPSRALITAAGLLVAGSVIVAATGDNLVGCGIRTVAEAVPGGTTATLEFRVDRMSGNSLAVTRVRSEEAGKVSAVRTHSRSLGGTAKCSSAGGPTTHFLVEAIGSTPTIEFLGEGPVRVVVVSAGVELAYGMVAAGHGSEIKLTW